MKLFSRLSPGQKAAWLIAAAAVLLALVAGGALLLRGGGRVVVNTQAQGDIPEPETAVPLAPIGDSRADRVQSVVIYSAGADGQMTAAVREISVTYDTTLAEAVVNAVLQTAAGQGGSTQGAGDIELLSLELSQGVATVNLSIDARRLEAERLHMLRAALVNSLLELRSVSYVNVLIDDREECIVNLPAGTMSRFDNDLSAMWLKASAEEQKFAAENQRGNVLTRNVTLYFGAPGGRYMLPEVRSVRIEDGDYLSEIVDQLLKGPSDTLRCERLLPSGSEYLRGEPEIVTAEDGSKIAVLSFGGEINDYLRRNEISTALALGSLTRSICGFVPEVEGVLCDIDGIMVTELYDADGQLMHSFGDGIMRRGDFDSLVGEVRTVYRASADSMVLIPEDAAMSRYDVDSPRALLRQLLEQPSAEGAASVRAIPAAVTDADILGVRVESDQVLINLSGAFYQACQGMSADSARAMVYSIVNTMCGLDGVKSVRLYFDGERVDYIAGAIYVRGPLLSNVGMVRG